MSHRVKGGMPPLPAPPPAIDAETEQAVAEVSQALATPSRVRILIRLWRSPAAVTALADDVAMEPSAVSHQLRILRDLRLVRATRSGRSIVYSLRNDHVAILLNEALNHIEHLRLEGRPLADPLDVDDPLADGAVRV